MESNTYISISFMSYKNRPSWNSGRIYTSVESVKLDLHLDVSYEQAKREMVKLMLRTGKMPEVVKNGRADSTMYMLNAFLD